MHNFIKRIAAAGLSLTLAAMLLPGSLQPAYASSDVTETESEDSGTYPVYFHLEQSNATVRVYSANYSESYAVQSYDDGDEKNCFSVNLEPGYYTYTVQAEGFYASTCAFEVEESGTVDFSTFEDRTRYLETYEMYEWLLDQETSSFSVDLETFTASENENAWDGVTLDVTWFEPDETVFYISTPEQLSGLAAIVNGIYNAEITTIYDYDDSGNKTAFSPEEYASYENAKIVLGCSVGSSSSGNQVTTDDYYYSGKGYDFDGCTIYLTEDLDMGGYKDADGNWTGARYMPIGGQYQMYYICTGLSDGASHLGSSFNGTLDGQGHTVYNIYCDRTTEISYGDATSIGLIGRLGNHDSDYSTWKTSGDDGGNYPAYNPTVRNVAVDGYISGSRSVGGIVGKVGQTSASTLSDSSVGGIIENCINFATVTANQTKGLGGIVGSGWNSGLTRNCVNFGEVIMYGSSGGPAGGIVGSNEHDLVNCYNVGYVDNQYWSSLGQAVGVDNSNGGYSISNCYWLTGSATGTLGYSNGGGYTYTYGIPYVTEVTDAYNGTSLSASEYMRSASFADDINGGSLAWVQADQDELISSYLKTKDIVDYPVPRTFTSSENTAYAEKIVKVSDVEKTSYIEGEYFDATGLAFQVYWSDGSVETIDQSCDYTLSINRKLETGDTQMEITVTEGGLSKTYVYEISVEQKKVTSMEIVSQPETLSYEEGEYFDPTGMKLKLTYTNGDTPTLVYDDGSWVDSTDAEIIYDVQIPLKDTPLSTTLDGLGIVVYYTDEAGITVVATTDPLTIQDISDASDNENMPDQDEEGTYLVSTADEWDWCAEYVNDGNKDISIRLTADIVVNDDFSGLPSFKGTLDGDGHRVTLNMNVEGESYVGLVKGGSGTADNHAVIKNIIVDGSITAKTCTNVGAIAGSLSTYLDIENCRNEALIIAESCTYVGGICGQMNNYNSIYACGNDGTIIANDCKNVGGITGLANVVPAISECYNKGSIYSYGGTYTGGITSYCDNQLTMTDCYNWGNITVDTTTGAGGIVGYVSNSDFAPGNLYNAGIITSSTGADISSVSGSIIGKLRRANFTCSVENYYALEGTATYSILSSQETTFITSDELIKTEVSEEFVLTEDHYPILGWEADNEDAKHKYNNGTCELCGAFDFGAFSIALDQKVFTYDGSEKKPAVTVSCGDIVLEETTDYTVSYEDNTEPGKATVTVTSADGNHTLTANFYIETEELSDMVLTLSEMTYTYDGTEKKPGVTLSTGTANLIGGTDYTIAYEDNVDVGTAVVIVTGSGDYEGTKYAAFTIDPADLNDTEVEVAESYAYTGLEINPVKITYNGMTLVEGTDYTVTYENNRELSTEAVEATETTEAVGAVVATGTVTGTGNYTGSVDISFAIVQADVADMDLVVSDCIYDGTAKIPELVLMNSSVPLVEDTDYTVAYSDNTEIGTASGTVTGIGNYTGTVDFTFRIGEISVTGLTISVPECTYDGTSQTPAVTVKDGDATLAEGTDYTVSYADNTEAGEASVTVTGMGNYIDSVTQEFAISPATVVGLDISAENCVYDGTAQTPAVTVQDGSVTLTEGTDYTVSCRNNTDAGTAVVTVTGMGNYTGSTEVTFTISALSVADMELSASDCTYDGTAQTPETVLKNGDVTLEAGTDYTISCENNIQAGTATGTVTGTGNYAGSRTFTFAVNPATVAGMDISAADCVYDGTAQTPAPVVKSGGVTLAEGTDYTVSYRNNTDAGTACVVVVGKGNYTGNAEADFTISKADQAVTVTADSSDVSVGDTVLLSVSGAVGDVTYTSSDTGVAAVDDSGAVTGVGAGTATITVAAAGTDNYNAASATVTITVTGAASGDTLMVRRGTTMYFNYTLKGGNADFSISAGLSTDQVLVGDWDGDGVDTICLRRGNECYFIDDITTMHVYLTVTYGRSGDEVLVGDWDGDGCDSLAVRRNGNHYYFCNDITSPDGDTWSETYGRATDEVYVGDWEGSGYDSLAVRRDGNYYYFSLSKVTDPDGDVWKTTFGRAADEVLVGDWDANGTDTLAMRRNGKTYFISNSIETPDSGIDTFTFGRTGDEVYAGKWK